MPGYIPTSVYPRQAMGYVGAITPGDVENLIVKVGTEIDTVKASADSAPLDDATRHAWEDFLAAWRNYDKNVSIIPILYLSKYHDVVDFQVKNRDWETVIKSARGGTLLGPSVQPTGSPLGALGQSGLIGAAIGAGAALVLVLVLRK